MLELIAVLLMKGLATIAMGLLLAIGFHYGNMMVQKMDLKMGLAAA
jgi:hypothetical protein